MNDNLEIIIDKNLQENAQYNMKVLSNDAKSAKSFESHIWYQSRQARKLDKTETKVFILSKIKQK